MQRPSALGLFLCDQVIFEEGTGKPTLVGLFDKLRCVSFPSAPRQLDVYAKLTDGQGRMDLDVVVSNSETDEQVAVRSREMLFANPLDIVHVRFRFGLSFPVAGSYLFQLFADGDAIYHCRLEVALIEE